MQLYFSCVLRVSSNIKFVDSSQIEPQNAVCLRAWVFTCLRVHILRSGLLEPIFTGSLQPIGVGQGQLLALPTAWSQWKAYPDTWPRPNWSLTDYFVSLHLFPRHHDIFLWNGLIIKSNTDCLPGPVSIFLPLTRRFIRRFHNPRRQPSRAQTHHPSQAPIPAIPARSAKGRQRNPAQGQGCAS